MAINYSNLFTLLGKNIKAANTLTGLYATLDTPRDAILSVYSAQSLFPMLSDVSTTWESFKSQINNWVFQVNQKNVITLTDRDYIQEQLLLPENSLTGILVAIYKDMIAQSKTINRSTVTLGSVSATTTNANAGTIVLDKVLDGISAPGSGMAPCASYNGVNSELSWNDSVTLLCIRDSENSSLTVGQEVFQWLGSIPKPNAFHWQDPGAGNGPTLTPLNDQSYLSNLDFESFTSNAPGSWTINTGSAGTHIFDDSSTPYIGSHALKFTGNASLAAINISQTISVSDLTPLKKYFLGCYVKGTAGTSAGTFTIQFEGTGYTASSTERIQMAFGDLAAQTSYGLEYFHFIMPAVIPDDLKLVIKWTGTPSAHSVYVDGMVFGPVTWWNGYSTAFIAGSGKFLAGDTLSYTVSNNDAGVFQTHFRKQFGMQLNSSGAPNINDSLAT